MYKPPQNSNRVKSIKSKFENIERNSKSPQKNITQNGYRNNLNNSPSKSEVLPENIATSGKQGLQRQHSDPVKRNIKRTPAFRVDKSVENTSDFQRNCFNRSTLFENKVKQFSAVKSNCDNNSNLINSEKNDINKNKLNDVTKSVPACSRNNDAKLKPILFKSKSSHDFQYIRSKFDKGVANNVNNKNNLNKFHEQDSENQSNCKLNDSLNGVDLSLLYTEPIPKSLRSKNVNEKEKPLNTEKLEPIFDNIYSTSTLKLSEKCPVTKDLSTTLERTIIDGLTDTLKTALKKPLPAGPAPKKPPRTFQHLKIDDNPNNLEKSENNRGRNISFLHLTKGIEKKLNVKPKSNLKKADPKYMLNKLENALRNNKLRARRQAKTDISTSGEDSDDSVLFRSKSNRVLPKLPSCTTECTTDPSDNPAFNFNCLNGLSCTNSAYEKIKEPNSSFFVNSPEEEPVYAEPYHYRRDSLDSAVRKREGSRTSRNSRNSLYYMSTPVLSDGEKIGNMSDHPCARQGETRVADLKITSSLNRQVS